MTTFNMNDQIFPPKTTIKALNVYLNPPKKALSRRRQSGVIDPLHVFWSTQAWSFQA